MKRVTRRDLAIFSRQLSTMVSSGMTILRALFVLEEQTESKLLKETIVAVRKDVEAGLSLSDSLARHPKVFSPLFVAMIRAGEIGGVLEDALMRVADQLEKEDALRRQVRSAMVYPVARDRLRGRRDDGARRLPRAGVRRRASSSSAANCPDAHPGHGVPVTHGHRLLVADVPVDRRADRVTFRKWKRSTWGRPQWDRFRLRVPMKIGASSRRSRSRAGRARSSSLTSAGVPLLQALEITGRTAGNVVVEEAMDDVIDSVKRGGTIAEPLAQAPIFPSMVSQMVAVGEATGELDCDARARSPSSTRNRSQRRSRR